MDCVGAETFCGLIIMPLFEVDMQQYIDIVTLYMCMGAIITRQPYYNLASICYFVTNSNPLSKSLNFYRVDCTSRKRLRSTLVENLIYLR